MMPTAKIKCPRCGEDVYFTSVDRVADIRNILNTAYYTKCDECGELVMISTDEFESHRVDG